MTNQRQKAGWSYWAIWILVGLYFAALDASGTPALRNHPVRILVVDVTLHLTWGAMVLGVLRNLDRIPMGGVADWRRWALYLALSLGMTFIGVVVAFVIIEAMGGPLVPIPGDLITRFWAWHWKVFHLAFVEFLMAIGAWVAFDFYHRYRERELAASHLEAELARAQHQALRMQLQPHFLFNALNTINSLIRVEPEQAEQMVTRLGDLLRYTLEQSGPQEVTLRQELLVLNCYLDIQRQRFGPKLGVVIACPDELLPALVPNLLLQPLVENAFKHGLGQRSRESCLLIHVSIRGEMLRLEVEDNGRGLGSTPVHEGIGLANTRSRLAALYGDQQEFELMNAPKGGALARVELPLHWRPLDPEADLAAMNNPVPAPRLRPRAVS
ncbi:MAG TPA: histidine kinase [Holophagaceae bacterium]|nr:histidine kinase [Holophagaceae bacterium]